MLIVPHRPISYYIGSKTVTLSAAQLPRIQGGWVIHGQENGSNFYSSYGVISGTIVSGRYKSGGATDVGAFSLRDIKIDFGNNQSHSNLAPFESTLFWRRVS